METDVEDNSWEDIYRLYGVCFDDIDAQPSHGAMGRTPLPSTDFSSIKKWF